MNIALSRTESNSTSGGLVLIIILLCFQRGKLPLHSNPTKSILSYGSLAILIVMAPLETLQAMAVMLLLL